MPDNKIDTDAIFTPPKGQRLFVEGHRHDRMVRWTLQLDRDLIWVPNRETGRPWELQLHGHIVAATFFSSVEERLKNQRESIDRMARHLKDHCPQLLGEGQCQHLNG